MISAVLTAVVAWATGLELGSPFTDGAVLQRDRPVPVWGWAKPGEKVTVGFAGQSKGAVADAKGRWRVDLDPMPASKTGRHLTVAAGNGRPSLVVSDVLVGEVWFCSGQSNCGVPLTGDNPHYRDRYGAMRAQITNRPYVRLAYEFDTADTMCSYAVPAIAKKFRADARLPRRRMGLHARSNWGVRLDEGRGAARLGDRRAVRSGRRMPNRQAAVEGPRPLPPHVRGRGEGVGVGLP